MIETPGDILAAVSTAFSVSLPYISTFAAVASVAVAWLVYRDQSSPDVVVYVSPVSTGSSLAALYIENIGKAPAYDVSVSVSGTLPVTGSCSQHAEEFLGHDMSLLMPGARRGAYLGVYHELLSRHRDVCCAVEVRYARRRGGRCVTASFPVDVLSFDHALLDKPVFQRKVEEIARESKRIANELAKVGAALEGAEKWMGAFGATDGKE